MAKDSLVQIRIASDKKASWLEQAKRMDMSLSAWIEWRCDAPPESVACCKAQVTTLLNDGLRKGIDHIVEPNKKVDHLADAGKMVRVRWESAGEGKIELRKHSENCRCQMCCK